MNQPRTCKACGAVVPPYTEKCPGCGKDSKFGNQSMSLVITFAILLLAPLFVAILLLFVL